MITLYAARDKKTGKFVNDITRPSRRFCEDAIRNYNARYPRGRYDLELVKLKCFAPEELNE